MHYGYSFSPAFVNIYSFKFNKSYLTNIGYIEFVVINKNNSCCSATGNIFVQLLKFAYNIWIFLKSLIVTNPLKNELIY